MAWPSRKHPQATASNRPWIVTGSTASRNRQPTAKQDTGPAIPFFHHTTLSLQRLAAVSWVCFHSNVHQDSVKLNSKWGPGHKILTIHIKIVETLSFTMDVFGLLRVVLMFGRLSKRQCWICWIKQMRSTAMIGNAEFQNMKSTIPGNVQKTWTRLEMHENL